ncbi:retinol dehydrogenase 12 [Thecamonas trahens ATCC 50062]|uniref:Retinol dehydrogenase 12 n=1 Tax=Thecamonas trahens ATCC 50062 TaxID=461836 RepID=A0A0L0DMT3_THETB|nr:retinol dehydrogenase 12 [Thecamonas trahens ATCC 50062]KNC53612.1 retinol dehydrogenase 12 [Thecamonas trahens ATCC 50062]|eukprot:XP_013761929.1 retinol dehydrogenase 12 [Thecamonas trahens ATCC 50062]
MNAARGAAAAAALALGLPLVAWPATFALATRLPEYVHLVKARPGAAAAAAAAAALPTAAAGLGLAHGYGCGLLSSSAAAAATFAAAWLYAATRLVDARPPVPPYTSMLPAQASPRLAVVTGATSGIGAASVNVLARAGLRVIFTTRSEERGARLAVPGSVTYCVVDPNELAQVAAFADAVVAASRGERAPLLSDEAASWLVDAGGVHILVNNAGFFPRPAPLTGDGLEPGFQVMHLSHHLLTKRLAPVLKACQGRVINVASEGHHFATPRTPGEPTSVFAPERIAAPTKSSLLSYGHNKLANILHTRYLRDDGIAAFALHPGAVVTSIWTFPYALGFLGAPVRAIQRVVFDATASLVMKTAEEGVSTVVYLALAPLDHLDSDLYWINLAGADATMASPLARSADLARHLAELSDILLAERGLE